MMTKTGITHGTPCTATTVPRLRLQTQTTSAPATPTAAIVAIVMLIGGAVSPWDRRRAVRNTLTVPKMANPTAKVTHPAAGDRLPLTRSVMTLLEIVITPPTAPLSVLKMAMSTPCQPRSPASVTTKEGILRRVMSVPWSAPIAAQARRPTMTAAHQGQFWGVPIRARASAAPTAPT